MRHFPTACLLLAACHFDPSTAALSSDADLQRADADSNAPDANPNAPDANPNAPDADPSTPDAGPQPCADWELDPTQFDPCNDIPATGTGLMLDASGTYSYDTGTDVFMDPDQGEVTHTQTLLGTGSLAVRVLITDGLLLGNNSVLRVTGTFPLLIVSWSNITISGELRAGSNRTNSGPGADASICSPAGNAPTDSDGGGGGGGGGFAAKGGDGGPGRNGDNPFGIAGGVSALGLRGGCPGGNGGDGSGSGSGQGRAGGGAVFLTARNQISVLGLIDASGEGGEGAQGSRSGGGGGGSGGLVGLESPSILLASTATLSANGGGGGGGGNNQVSADGQDGQASAVPAAGGAGENSPPGDGGDGGARSLSTGQAGVVSDRGGGGGGGGVGFIYVNSNSEDDQGATLSPARTEAPF